MWNTEKIEKENLSLLGEELSSLSYYYQLWVLIDDEYIIPKFKIKTKQKQNDDIVQHTLTA